MSYSALYLLPEGGHMIEDSILYSEYRNSYGTGMVIWMTLWKKYLLENHGPFNMFNLQPLWDLQNEAQVSDSDLFVLFSTFDGCIIRAQVLDLMAKSFKAFSEEHREFLEGKVWHGPKIARDLLKIQQEHPEMNAFIMQNSISGIAGHEDPFYFPLKKV